MRFEDEENDGIDLASVVGVPTLRFIPKSRELAVCEVEELDPIDVGATAITFG